jgi:hypothetical protein
MKRKLIKQGIEGLTLYLPKKWADARNLKAGNEVDIAEVGDVLQITAGVQKGQSITLSLTHEDSDYALQFITHCYRLGYDAIVITSTDAKIRALVEKQAGPLLLGFEVTDITPETITLSNISEPSEDKFEVMLRRIFLIIQHLGEETNALLRGDKYSFSPAEEREQLDRLIVFCKRTITKKLNGFTKPMPYWELLTYLMAIGHGYHYLYEHLIEKKVKKGEKTTLTYAETLSAYVQQLYDAYYQKEVAKIRLINKKRLEYCFTLPEKLIDTSTEPNVIAKLQYIMRLTQLASGSVFYLIADITDQNALHTQSTFS